MGAEPFLGQIQPFAGNFAPNGWQLCAGQLLPIQEYNALFSLIGTRYGGDGRTNFGLPDLRSRAVMGAGQGPGLTARPLASTGGAETVTLTAATLGAHSHAPSVTANLAVAAAAVRGTVGTPTTGVMLAAAYNTTYNANISWYTPSSSNPVDLKGIATSEKATLGPQGGGQPHENMQPWAALNYIIAVVGLWPQRN